MDITSTGNGLFWYKIIERNKNAQMEQFEKQPQVARDISYFQNNIGSVKSVDDLLKNRRLLEFTLTAFQLEEQVDAKGLLKKVLTEDPAVSNSLVNRLADPRYKQLANTLKGLSEGSNPFNSQSTVNSIIDGYKTNAFEKAQEDKNSSVREAMFFNRTIGEVTSLSQIMANKTLLKVVRVTLGLPDSFGLLDYSEQKARLSKELDTSKFQDAEYIEKFTEKFLMMSDMQTTQAALNGTSSSSGALSIADLVQPINNYNSIGGISINLLV